jgi:phosphoribosylglycinamide formyltransferase-1
MKKSDSSSATSTIILISGYGTNLQAILDQTINNQLPIKIISVLSDNPKSYGIERANRSDIPTKIINYHNYINKADFCWNV